MRSYTITQFDNTLAAIATRFHVHPQALLEANIDRFPTGANAADPISGDMLGSVIAIPYDESYTTAWTWEITPAHEGETLSAFCTRMNHDRRIDPTGRGSGMGTPPWLTPQYLLDSPDNTALRAAFGGDPDHVTLTGDFPINVPYPISPPLIGGIFAAPSARTTVELEPGWLTELRATYAGMRQQAARLEHLSAQLHALQAAGLNEARRLIGMCEVLTVVEDHPDNPDDEGSAGRAQLAAVRTALENARDAAIEALFNQILHTEGGAQWSAATDLTHALYATIQGDPFKSAVDSLVTNVSRYPTVVNEICAALAYVYQVLIDSPIQNSARDDVDAAVRGVASSRPVSGAPLHASDPELAAAVESIPDAVRDFPLASLILIGLGLTGATAASVGNLPGPSSLAVACYRLYAVSVRAAIMASGADVTASEIAVRLAIEIGFLRNGAATSEAEGDAIVIAIGELRSSVTQTTTVTRLATSTSIVEELNIVDARASNALMTNAQWLRGVSVVGLLTAGFAITNMIRTGTVSAGDGAATIGGLGAASLGFARLAGYSESLIVRVVAPGLAVFGFAFSAYQWRVDASLGRDTTGDALGTFGAGLLALSLIPEPFAPVLAVVGGILTVASIGYTLYHDDGIRDLFRNGAKRWFVCQARTYQTGQHYLRHPELAATVTALEQAILNADFYVVAITQRPALHSLVDSSELNMFFPDPH